MSKILLASFFHGSRMFKLMMPYLCSRQEEKGEKRVVPNTFFSLTRKVKLSPKAPDNSLPWLRHILFCPRMSGRGETRAGKSDELPFSLNVTYPRASLVAQRVKRLFAMWETWVWSLGWEDPLEKEMAAHSSTLAWEIPWTEEPGGLQSMGSQRVKHDWVTERARTHFYLHIFQCVGYSPQLKTCWKHHILIVSSQDKECRAAVAMRRKSMFIFHLFAIKSELRKLSHWMPCFTEN